MIYDAARGQLEKQVRKWKERGVDFEADDEVYNPDHCRQAFGRGEPYSWCEMYTLPDLCMEWTVDDSGHVPLRLGAGPAARGGRGAGRGGARASPRRGRGRPSAARGYPGAGRAYETRPKTSHRCPGVAAAGAHARDAGAPPTPVQLAGRDDGAWQFARESLSR